MADITSAKQLREERAPIAHQMMTLNDKIQAEKRLFNAEEEQLWARLDGEYNLFTKRIEIAERTENILTEQNSPIDEQPKNSGAVQAVPGRGDYDGRKALEGYENHREEPTAADHALALQAWCRAQVRKPLTEAHNRACRLTGIDARSEEFVGNLHNGSYRQFRNALSAQSGVAGQFTVPEGFVNNLERALLAFGGMRQVSDVMRTESGNDMPWPTINATSNKGRILGENTTDSTLLEPTFGRIVFRAHKYTSDFIKVPVELFEDSAFQLAATLGDLQGEAIGRIQNDHFTTGTGAGQPTGIVTACLANSATQAAASAAAISFDDIMNLIHSVDPAYRDQPGAGFMLHDSILLAVRKLKSGDGQYLWQPSNQVGVPDRILGYALTINQSMDSSIASGAESVLFGALGKYKIRDAGDVRMVRLNERFADSDQVGFICFLRSDGNLLDAGVRPVKVLQH